MWNDLLFRLRTLFRRSDVEADLDDELRLHLDHQIEKNVKAGMNRESATRAARLELGGFEQVKEATRANWGVAFVETTLQDLRYAFRQLVKSPAFTLAALLTLALGIGATTGIFTVANSLLLRSLPVRDPQDLVVIARNPAHPVPSHSFGDYVLMRDHIPDSFTGVAASNEGNAVGLSGAGSEDVRIPEVVSAAFVSDNYFEVLGVGPAVGRLFAQGSAPSVVLSYALWHRRFGGSPSVVGRPLRLNSQNFTVAGVTAREFTGTRVGNAPDLYVRLETFPRVIPLMRRNWNAPRRQWLVVTARMEPGASTQRAIAQIDSLFAGKQRSVFLPGAQGLSPSQFSKPVWILLLAAGLLLLLACANVAGLLLARALQREREIAVRLALGASRFRLIRQMVTESLLLSIAGGTAGLFVGLMGARTMVRLLPSGGPFPLSLDVSPDARVLGFAFAVSVLTALLFGVGPALRSSRRDLAFSLKAGAVARGLRRRLPDPRRSLVVVQVALSLVLLVSVGLLGRTLGRLDSLDLGFARAGRLFVYVQPGQFGYEGQRAREFYERLRERVAALPGVRQASLADYAPLDGGNDSGAVSRPGQDTATPVESNAITEGYLSTVGIPLLAGRNIEAHDSAVGAPPVGLISENLAKTLFSGESPIGQRLSYGDRFQANESWQIVGVVRDAHYFGLREKPVPMVYMPVDRAMSRLVLCVQTDGLPKSLIASVRGEVAALDPAVPVLEARTITDRVDEQNALERLLATLLGAFGGIALLLAAIGLYGVLAFGVAARSREIGIRTALGAPRWDSVAGVLADVWMLVGAGAVAGLAASIAVAQVLTGFLFGVQPFDPISFAASILVLAVAAAVASYVPARRAARVDPVVALRHE